jgi:hypothetical protein
MIVKGLLVMAVIAVVLVAVLGGHRTGAQTGSPRFQLAAAGSWGWRLDTHTGALIACTASGGTIVCYTAPPPPPPQNK